MHITHIHSTIRRKDGWKFDFYAHASAHMVTTLVICTGFGVYRAPHVEILPHAGPATTPYAFEDIADHMVEALERAEAEEAERRSFEAELLREGTLEEHGGEEDE